MIKLKVKEELKNMSVEQLAARINLMRQELLNVRIGSATRHIKSFSSIQKQLKKTIACALTYMRQKND
ncbi:MAG: 50S ribosomal protein L29 [Candidatus Babeliaceae bacterium]|jgi:ribosomal protein L29